MRGTTPLETLLEELYTNLGAALQRCKELEAEVEALKSRLATMESPDHA